MVLAALGKLGRLPEIEGPAPEACFLVLADAASYETPPDALRAWARGVARTPSTPHDPLVARLAAELAARGIVRLEDLSVELRAAVASRARSHEGSRARGCDRSNARAVVWPR